MQEKIVIRGAKTHNLKNINLELPRDQLVVITGLSGSGKSSLAFDTLYAEGQRRYVESLSAYARQFLGMMEKPDVETIEGLSPAISIDQKTTSKNPRSTVGTVTEIHDYLRLLFARIGKPHCPSCQEEISGQTTEQIAEQMLGRGDLVVAAPLVRGRKGEYKKLFSDLVDEGYTRAIVDGEIYRLEDVPELEKQIKHDISLVIDRLKADNRDRLSHATALALEKSGGLAEAWEWRDNKLGKASLYSQNQACPKCGYTLPELEPRLFSFNSPHGACDTCQGLGHKLVIDPDLLLPDPTMSIDEGALRPFERSAANYDKRLFEEVCYSKNIPTNIPWQSMKKADRDLLLFGTGKQKFSISYRNRFGYKRDYSSVAFRGVVGALQRKYERTESDWHKESLSKLLSQKPCPDCDGQRLSPAALHVLIEKKSIAEVSAMPIDESYEWIRGLSLNSQEKKIARLLLKEIKDRLGFLVAVGLHYLALARAANTLSGGEAQRIRLATQIGSGLVGVLYILDEPSIGLHPRDNAKLLKTLERLRDLGNSVLVVEHDEETMKHADWLVDIGPGAGSAGGKIVAEGTPEEVAKSESETGQFLSGKRKIAVPEERRKGRGQITFHGARENNLQDVDASVLVGAFNCLTGVSGSGKSSLLSTTLYPALANRLHRARLHAGNHDKITGIEQIDKVIQIDQSPIGRTPRSNPATYTGLFDPIRKLFAGTREARARGYKPGRFSFNVQGGRCETCRGDGEIQIEMHFLPDVYVPCSECEGARYNPETLEIRYRGKTIAEVLDMSVAEALQFFQNVTPIKRKLQTLSDVGLGYIGLGQPATTLSGGEAQRVKLASELSRVATGDTLYILDEPTTGLHFSDVEKLLHVLQRLVDAGNTVVVIEHNLDVIKNADWIIDLGPGGGRDGGKIVAEGPPEKVAKLKRSETGKFLKSAL